MEIIGARRDTLLILDICAVEKRDIGQSIKALAIATYFPIICNSIASLIATSDALPFPVYIILIKLILFVALDYACSYTIFYNEKTI